MLDLKKDVTDFLAKKEDPVKLKSILKHLGLPRSDQQYLKSVLSELVKEGVAVRDGVRYWSANGEINALQLRRKKNARKDEVIGRLSINTKGTGFVEVSRGDWMVPPAALGKAKTGDIVRARKTEMGRAGRVIGEIVDIEEFGTKRVLGIFENRGPVLYFTAFNDYKLPRHDLLDFPKRAENGSVGLWLRREDGKWDFGGFLGNMADPAVDEQIVLAENDIAVEFPLEALDQCEPYSEDYDFQLGIRRDFRDEMVFTVDGADAKDFDDALHFKPLADGCVEVGVHIADVAEFVPDSSPLDVEARKRGNSTYLPHKAIPMLPHVLSNGLCSLKPDVPRYTLSLVAILDRKRRIKSYELCKGLIKSSFRLTYSDVYEMGVEKSEAARARFDAVLPSVDLALTISRELLQIRHENGGLKLDMGETRIHLNEDLLLDEVSYRRQTDANRMIEAFMCMANECVAQYMFDLGIGIPYRLHDEPDPQKMEQLEVFLRACGVTIPEHLNSDPGHALNEVIEHLSKGPSGEVLQVQVLKSLKMAEYHPTKHWHFGLGSSHYTHFTSPIRRYADLVLHQRLTRILNEPDLGPEYFDNTHLEEICKHISKRERSSARAEKTFVQLKLLRRMLDELGNEFDGVITDLTNYGMFVRLDKWYVSGLVHIDSMDDDYYSYNPENMAMVGKRRGRTYRVGSAVSVQVQMVDLIARRLDLGLVGQDHATAEFVEEPVWEKRGSDRGRRRKVKRTLPKGKSRRRR